MKISVEALRAYNRAMRGWSGWADSVLRFEKPTIEGVAAMCSHDTHTFLADPEQLLLNPNRVLLNVTPFRMRQEAVLTGALLHEAGHARYSKWQPRTPEAVASFAHSDGEPVAAPTLALARLMEEPRIEGRIAAEAPRIGADGLEWTMRASAAHLLPMTELSTDPAQRVMDIISSWALRAGRQIALYEAGMVRQVPTWVGDYNTFLNSVLVEHLTTLQTQGAEVDDPHSVALQIASGLNAMIRQRSDAGLTMVDIAREVLDALFPETPPDERPSPNGQGCSEAQQSGGSSPSQESGEGEGQPDAGGAGEEQEDGEGEASEGEASEGEASEGQAETAEQAAQSERLAQIEATAEQSDKAEAREEMKSSGGLKGGTGDSVSSAGWRQPTKEEREVQKRAEKFLRNLIDPAEAAKRSITDSPSSTVDGAALAVWRASGETHDPRFFVRTRREVEPSPPVKIAVLVDVSSSMEQLQEPSALLSWALANAAVDLRNFAGRGKQIESTLIHWGNSARVIQENGTMLPGIRTVSCREGTHAMGRALALVEEQIPGFFSAPEHPENRLLVQFTDWELAHTPDPMPWLERAAKAGVNMLTVTPKRWSEFRTSLPSVLSQCTGPWSTSRINYDPKNPERVWDAATQLLRP